MISEAELVLMKDIKKRALAKQPVADWEKQFMLDLAVREQAPVRAVVAQRAKNSGFNTTGIKTR